MLKQTQNWEGLPLRVQILQLQLKGNHDLEWLDLKFLERGAVY